MRVRSVMPLALLALVAFVVPACGSDKGGDQAAKTSPDRPTTTVKNNDSSEGSSGDSGSSDSGNGDSGSADSGNGDSGSSDTTLPDLGDLGKDLGLDQLSTCVEVATAYSGLYFQALAGSDGAAKAEDEVKKLKEQLPADLHDDIDVVANAIKKVAEDGLLSAGKAFESPEYTKANQAITDYLTQTCGAGSPTAKGGE